MDPATQLREMGFEVHEFSVYHFRVNGQFDYWLPRGKWHDRINGERGQKPLDQIAFFVSHRIKNRGNNGKTED